jgi:FAD/FMN-containing dehydrogenase
MNGNGDQTILRQESVVELRGSLRGEVLMPGNPDYDGARLLWNAAYDRRPALIVRCENASDVVAAVNYARTENLPIAVRAAVITWRGTARVMAG